MYWLLVLSLIIVVNWLKLAWIVVEPLVFGTMCVYTTAKRWNVNKKLWIRTLQRIRNVSSRSKTHGRFPKTQHYYIVFILFCFVFRGPRLYVINQRVPEKVKNLRGRRSRDLQRDESSFIDKLKRFENSIDDNPTAQTRNPHNPSETKTVCFGGWV